MPHLANIFWQNGAVLDDAILPEWLMAAQSGLCCLGTAEVVCQWHNSGGGAYWVMRKNAQNMRKTREVKNAKITKSKKNTKTCKKNSKFINHVEIGRYFSKKYKKVCKMAKKKMQKKWGNH